MAPSRSHPALALLAAAACLAVAVADADRAVSQEVTYRGWQAEASFRGTTLLGGAYPDEEVGLGAQAAVRYLWPSGVSLGVGGVYGQPEDLSLPGSNPRRTMEEYGPYAELRYQVQDLGAVKPYAGLRAGWKVLQAEHIPDAKGSGPMGGVVLGTEVMATDRMGFRLNLGGSAFTSPGFVEGFANAGTAWSAEVGLTYFFGDVRRDSDGDGVHDSVDACPGTPRGVEVNSSGCVRDEDDDGQPDLRDACPGTPDGFPVDERGCALDSDDDGVPDGRDECSGTPAGVPVDGRGCVADADGDGVNDRIDACPDTPSGSEVDDRGCALDDDGDGVGNSVDTCPGTLSGVEVNGDGCSDVQAGLREGRHTVSGMPFRFQSGQVEVDAELRQILEQIAAEMERDPEMELEIRVYTDTLGPASANRQMSETLAETVRNFLLRRSADIGATRLQAVGRGESTGEEGPANRVVFIVRSTGGGGDGGR